MPTHTKAPQTIHKTRRVAIGRIALRAALLLAVVLSGCSLLQPRPEETARQPLEQELPQAEAEPAAVAEDPGRADAAAVLSGLPQRQLAFMLEFQQRVEAGDWQWVLEHAEENHYHELVVRTGMDEESYLAFLLRIGESFDRRIRRDDTEPGYFSPYDTVTVVYTDYRREHVTTIVEGLFYNQQQRSIDFTVNLLGDLIEMRLTGAYY